MPELPDLTVYLDCLAPRVLGQPLAAIRIANPFVLRTVSPRADELSGRRVIELGRLGKRIVIALEGDAFIVVHLMIAGRFRWRTSAAQRPKVPASITLATFDFPTGTLFLTEAGTKRRASLHIVDGRDAVTAFDRGGLEVLDSTLPEFRERLRHENHTVKRSLTDPRIFSGIGNAYSDEILHRAKLSPLALTQRMTDEEIARLYSATIDTLREWTDRLRREVGDDFPEKVTAFRDGMAVHGRFKQPCPVCNAPVQRIRYADNETNYCARCQTKGRLLADRALSRIFKKDWPRLIDGVE